MNSPSGTSGAPIKYANVAAASDGNQDLIAAVTGKKIRVVGFCLSVDVAGLVILRDKTADTARATFKAAGTYSYSGGPSAPAFETIAGDALEANNAAGTDLHGFIAYQEV